jgi:hypothetical protein
MNRSFCVRIVAITIGPIVHDSAESPTGVSRITALVIREI